MKAHKLITLFILNLLIIKVADAQEFSILGGANLSNMTIKTEGKNISDEHNFQPRIGGHAGLLIDLKFGKTFSLEPGIIFITKGHKFQAPTIDEVDFRYNTLYMDIPVLAKFNWNPKENFRLYGGLGPVIGIGLIGKIKNEGLTDAQREYIQANYPELPVDNKKVNFGTDIKRMDVGLMFTGGINVAGVRLGVFYNQGIRSLEYRNYTQRNRVAGVHIGYTIQFRNKKENSEAN